GRDLGLTVRTAGDILIVDRSHILAGDLFDAPNALVACLVRQPRSSRHIPDGINAVHVRSVELVDDDSPGLRLDTGLLEPYILDIAHDAHGGENLITFECFLALLRLHLHLQGLAARIDGLHLHSGKDFDALLLEGALELLGHVGVFDRHEAIQQLDDGHLGAHLMIEVGELHADRAGAADHEPLRRLLLEQSLAIRDDLLPVDGQRRDLAGTSTGGNDDMLRLDRLLLADGLAIHVGRGFDRNFALAGQAAMPEEDVDLVLLHQELDALVHLVGHAPTPLDDLREIRVHCAVQREAVIREVPCILHDFRTLEEGLRGDAPDVQTYPTELVALDDCGLEP